MNAAGLPVATACRATERIVGRSRGGMSCLGPGPSLSGERVAFQAIRRGRVEPALNARIAAQSIDGEYTQTVVCVRARRKAKHGRFVTWVRARIIIGECIHDAQEIARRAAIIADWVRRNSRKKPVSAEASRTQTSSASSRIRLRKLRSIPVPRASFIRSNASEKNPVLSLGCRRNPVIALPVFISPLSGMGDQ